MPEMLVASLQSLLQKLLELESAGLVEPIVGPQIESVAGEAEQQQKTERFEGW